MVLRREGEMLCLWLDAHECLFPGPLALEKIVQSVEQTIHLAVECDAPLFLISRWRLAAEAFVGRF